jgi:hypothetical protein
MASSDESSMDASDSNSSTQGNKSWLAPIDTFWCRTKGAASFKDKATEHQTDEVSIANIRVNLNSLDLMNSDLQ